MTAAGAMSCEIQIRPYMDGPYHRNCWANPQSRPQPCPRCRVHVLGTHSDFDSELYLDAANVAWLESRGADETWAALHVLPSGETVVWEIPEPVGSVAERLDRRGKAPRQRLHRFEVQPHRFVERNWIAERPSGVVYVTMPFTGVCPWNAGSDGECALWKTDGRWGGYQWVVQGSSEETWARLNGEAVASRVSDPA